MHYGADRIPEAEAYVQTRFYPPLPPEYGALAVEALNLYNEIGPDATLVIPEGIQPVPRQAYTDVSGETVVSTAGLIESLRLWHMLDNDE